MFLRERGGEVTLVRYALMVWASTLLDAERRHDWIVARTIGEDNIANGVGVVCMGKLQSYLLGVDAQDTSNGSD